tara:strand:+ start:2302 stop:2994 length:693 start_codon:yes stop_codon:yes gene_type:complete
MDIVQIFEEHKWYPTEEGQRAVELGLIDDKIASRRASPAAFNRFIKDLETAKHEQELQVPTQVQISGIMYMALANIDMFQIIFGQAIGPEAVKRNLTDLYTLFSRIQVMEDPIELLKGEGTIARLAEKLVGILPDIDHEQMVKSANDLFDLIERSNMLHVRAIEISEMSDEHLSELIESYRHSMREYMATEILHLIKAEQRLKSSGEVFMWKDLLLECLNVVEELSVQEH